MKISMMIIWLLIMVTDSAMGGTRADIEQEFDKHGTDLAMKQLVAGMNKNIPIKVNKYIVIRHFSYISSSHTMYTMYVSNNDPSKYTKEELSSYRQFLRQLDINKSCKDIIYRVPMERGVSYQHSYEYINGEYQMGYVIDIDDCE